MNKILMYIFSYTKIGKLLDGKKTVIGAVFIFLVSLLHGLEQIAPLFPEVAPLASVTGAIRTALEAIEPYLQDMGIGLITAGLLHKVAKKKEAKK
jgi:hypothetical protein